MVVECLEAADQLSSQGVNASVLDLRWLNPLDADALEACVRSAGRVLVVHEANTTGGFGAEIVARIASDCFFDLDQPPRRIALPDVRVPAAPTLQAGLVPTAATITASSLELLSA
jgi:pyruvate/2-oxoglutarate/acetoin dehydrogenase E1 component